MASMEIERINFWEDRPVLVTGATGLLGGWLVKRLFELNADVVCLVRDWVPQSLFIQSELFGRAKIVCGDVRDQELLERVIGEYEINSVFHLAAQTIVGIANRNPVSTFQTNIGGTWALLEACRRSPTVRQIVIASSDKAYGEYEQLPYAEDTSLSGKYPYDASKAGADLIAQSYAKTYDLPIAITRCGNFYGGGDLNWNRIVPGTIRSILKTERPIIRSDGKMTRDYFYIEDAVAAYILLGEHLARNADMRGQAFNFSNEEPLTVMEIVKKILGIMGAEVEPLIRNEISNEIEHQYLSAAKAKRILNWVPLYTMEEGLKRTIRWYQDFLGENP